MQRIYRHIGFWLCSMIVLLCQACGSDDGSEPSQLDINVYTPGRAVVTRADVEKINPDEAEKAVNSLQIWVFVAENKSSDAGSLQVGQLVGYLSPQITTPTSTDFVGKYQMTVSDLFATLRPKVNVYVVANVGTANTGNTLTAGTSMKDLENALIQHDGANDYFGLTSPMTTAVPAGGLPMSGVLKNTEVGGSRPVLKVQTPVTVVRAVSKVRFVFSRSKQYTSEQDYGSSQELKITGVTIDNEMIPKAEYLFLSSPYSVDGHLTSFHLKDGYESGTDDGGIALSPLSAAASQIPEYENPTAYAYTGAKTGQDYEDLINTGIGSGHLAEIGKFYIRESDKPISGKIHYTIGTDPTPKSSPFHMAREGEFSRNHTWIVFGYFSAKELLVISSVNVLPWQYEYTDYPVYNW